MNANLCDIVSKGSWWISNTEFSCEIPHGTCWWMSNLVRLLMFNEVGLHEGSIAPLAVFVLESIVVVDFCVGIEKFVAA
jgi:hypothetical protein